jgi:hypothetical protein
LHNGSQTIEAATHVGKTGREPDAGAGGNHQGRRSAARMMRSVSGSG